MNIFLTGGTGFIGKSFLKLAIKKNHYVFATTRKIKNKKISNVKWLVGNFDKNWKNELKKSDMLVHFASTGVLKKKYNTKDIFEVNFLKPLNLLLNAIKYGCKNWLIISTSSEYGKVTLDNKRLSINSSRKPKTDYSKSKVLFTDMAISLAKKHNCKARIMRLFPIYGPGEHHKRFFPSLKRAALKGKNFIVKNPSELTDFTKVDYATEALMDAINLKKNPFKHYQIWHISENKPITVSEFAKKYWKFYKAKGKLILKNKKKVFTKHVSNKQSLWKLN